jgi:hypothetical protein
MAPVISLLRSLPLLETLTLTNFGYAQSKPASDGAFSANSPANAPESWPITLPCLRAFSISCSRQPFNQQYDFLLSSQKLTKLVIRSVELDGPYIHRFLARCGAKLLHLELDTDCGDFWDKAGDWKDIRTSIHGGRLAIDLRLRDFLSTLGKPERIGNEVIQYVPNLRHLVLGGTNCVTGGILKLIQKGGLKLDTLVFVHTWPFPSETFRSAQFGFLIEASDVDAAETVICNPSGIAPQDVLDALDRGLLDNVHRLEFVSMKGLWHPEHREQAWQVKMKCDTQGIVFVCR